MNIAALLTGALFIGSVVLGLLIADAIGSVIDARRARAADAAAMPMPMPMSIASTVSPTR